MDDKIRCQGGMDDVKMSPQEFVAFEQRERLLNYLYSEGLTLVNGAKLYGVEIDITNPRDVIAALFAAYQNKELMVREFPPRYAKSDGA